jgi:hypothetical protein
LEAKEPNVTLVPSAETDGTALVLALFPLTPESEVDTKVRSPGAATAGLGGTSVDQVDTTVIPSDTTSDLGNATVYLLPLTRQCLA